MTLNIKDILNKTEEYFKSKNISSPRLDAEVLLADLLDTERVKLYVNFDYPLKKEEIMKYREMVKKRAQGTPVSYLTQKKEFMSLEFHVEPGVLIPRPETEELIEKILKIVREDTELSGKIVDVGTGSGAILVSLLYYLPDAKGIGIDISDQAVRVAKENIKKFKLSQRAGLLKGDLLEPLLPKRSGEIDLVVSNPPYISTKDYKNLDKDVKSEPEEALHAGKDGLDIYRRLIPQAKKILRDNGLLALEIGDQQGEAIGNLFSKLEGWDDFQLLKDGAGKDRFVFVRTGGDN
ncbi:MAG: peptide chain release factor N(5)-glutamine methyltransferase [Bacillota bacterium]